MINSFTGKYFFLSNFYDAPVSVFGMSYLNSEAAFQAQKLDDPGARILFTNLSPSEAKKLGRLGHILMRIRNELRSELA